MPPTTKLVCICCPLGCNLSVIESLPEYLITGNKCPRGKRYAVEELTAPKRVLTSTVKLTHGSYPVIPVKTDRPIPKEKIFTIMSILASVTVASPINMGDVIIENVAGTGANIVATKTV